MKLLLGITTVGPTNELWPAQPSPRLEYGWEEKRSAARRAVPAADRPECAPVRVARRDARRYGQPSPNKV